MDRDLIDKILSKADGGDNAALTTLYNGCMTALKRYEGDQSKASLADWQASEKALKEMVGRLEQKYYPHQPVLESVLAAVGYLNSQGYKLSKSKAYKDAKAGLLKVRGDKTVTEAEALAYAARVGLEKVVPGTSGSAEEIQARKIEAELSLSRAREEKLRFELERERGKYLLKTDVAVENATKFGAIEAGIKHLMRTKALEFIALVGGDGKKAPELVGGVQRGRGHGFQPLLHRPGPDGGNPNGGLDMPRNMSFALTTEQMRRGEKTVTRRNGWWFIRPGEIVNAVEKSMGLKKGEKIKRIGRIRIVSTRPEPLNAITDPDVAKEGFAGWTRSQFIEMYSRHNRCADEP